MVDDKMRCILAVEADCLLSTDAGCLMNIGGRLRRTGATTRVMHLAELLQSGVETPAMPSVGSQRPI
jgi:L-lactate dehydrogenase complex protein LldE